MTLSTNKAEVVPVELLPHTNSDNLSLVKVFEYTVVVRTADWIGKTKAIYITPDSIVSTNRPEFAFLKRDGRDKERIKVKRLRGVLSMGLLIPAPDSAEIGQDFATELGVTRYEPELTLDYEIGEDEHAPPIFAPKYDVDTIYKYAHMFIENEPVFIQEKINGQNMRAVCVNNKIYCGSRTRWKKEYSESAWWKTYYNTSGIEKFCKDYPEYVLYGETYGNVGGFRYGVNQLSFAAFDILHNGVWLNSNRLVELCNQYEIPLAPVISYNIPFNLEQIKKLANGPSTISTANHCREGVVVRPIVERNNIKYGRTLLKCVGEDYYNSK